MRRWALLLMLMLASASLSIAQDFQTPEELADPNGRFADVDGVSIYYLAFGDPSNPAVIFVHGFGGSTFTWRDNLNVIADAGYYAVAIDLPPFGLSDKSPEIGYTRAHYADYIAGLMDILGIEQAILVGHSMGGTAIAQFALDYPQRLAALVLVAAAITDEDAALGGDIPTNGGLFDALDPANPAAVTLLRNILRPSTFTRLLSSAYYDPAIVTNAVAAGYQRPLNTADWPEGFLAFLNADNSDDPTTQELGAAVDTPVLIVWGEDDTWVPIAAGEAIHAALPQSHLVTYTTTGHLPMEEQVTSFNNDLLSFLQSLGDSEFDANLLVYHRADD